MHSHLAIIGAHGELTLDPATSVTVTEKNPMLNDVEMFTQTIPLSFDQNRHLLKNMDDANSDMRFSEIDGERFRFVVDGIPFRNAAIKVKADARLKDTIDVNFDATNRTFKDMIANMRCRDVTVGNDILIGEKISNIQAHFSYHMQYMFTFVNYLQAVVDDENRKRKSIIGLDPPATGFSFPGRCTPNDGSHSFDTTVVGTKVYGEGIEVNIPQVYESYINVSAPYPQAKYCNARVCYAHHALDADGKTSSDVVQKNDANPAVEADKSPYWVLPADRPASGICFYVAYFLERLFKTLGVAYDMSALTNIEDFNYMAFFTTACKYNAEESHDYLHVGTLEAMNKWLSDRGCGGQMQFDFGSKQYDFKMTDEADFTVFVPSGPSAGQYKHYHYEPGDEFDFSLVGGEGTRPINNIFVRPIFLPAESTASGYIYNMYANSDNFPDANVSEVISSLENAFGVRFCYDAEINKVTVRLLRDMFRDTQSPIHLKGTVTEMVRVTENIKGVRMHYDEEGDSMEQRDNIRYGVRDYDTDYDYIEYPEGRTVIDKTYAQIADRVDSGDMKVYVIPQTGNAIRVKVDKDASTVKDLKPVLFEVGAYKGLEVGDCSKAAEDDNAVKDISIGFQPISVNDVNFRNGGGQEDYQPILVPYIDEDMEHEFVECRLQNIINTEFFEVYFDYVLKHYEAYDPTDTDDGQSPLQHHDWGLAVGILRTGDGGAGVENYDPNYDGFGNWRWRDIADNYCIASDTMDQSGRWLGRTNPATAFSLKIAAYKPFRYKYVTVSGQQVLKISTDPRQWTSEDGWLIPCNDDERNVQGLITKRIRSRGLADTFMPEYIHFLLYRQKYHVEAICTAAELAEIPGKWLRKWEIDGKVGWINQIMYPINTETGIGKTEIEFYVL